LYVRRYQGATANTSTFDLGLNAGNLGTTYGASSLTVGTAYKIVVSYTANPSGTLDVGNVYVNPVGQDPTTWTPEISQTIATDPTASMKSFVLTPGAVGTGPSQNEVTMGRIIVGDSTADVLPVPAAPTSSAATAPGTGGFTANWASSSGATKYYLDVATDSGFTSFVGVFNNFDVGNVTSYSVTGSFTGGTTLYYRVRAYNTAGNSTNSAPQTVGITAALLPTVSNGTASGTVTWVNGPGWSPNNPVSASDATVTFNGALTAGATLTANNDSPSDFQLNSLVFANTGSGNVNVTGNPFRFSANGTTNPTINFANVSTLVQRVSNALQLDAALTVSQPGSSTVNSILDGVISGASGMTKSGSGFVHLTGTNNSFSGGVTVGNGTLVVGNIGMAGFNSSLGTNGTITLGGSGISGTLRWGDYATGYEVSDKAITLPGSTGGGTIDVRGSSYYLTLNGNIDTGANISARTLTLTGNGQGVGLDGTTNSLVINGLISGNAGLTVNGSGNRTVVLANTNNSFAGAFSISGSTGGQTYKVKAAKIGNSGENSSIGTYGTINIGNNTANTFNMLTYTGSGEATDKTLNMAGTVGPVSIVNNGLGTLKFNNPVTITAAGAKTFYPDQDEPTGVMEFAGNIPDSSAGATTIKKAGAGKLVLSANNSFTGGMRLAGGILELLNPSALAAGNYVKFESAATNGAVPLVKVGYAGNGANLGNLQVAVDGTINLGTDPTASIRFATANTWTAGKILSVANSTSGGKMYILSSAGLDLSQIKSLENPTWPASLDANGLLTFTNPTPANTAPTITSGGAFSVSENSTAVTTVAATDAEANALTYSISSGSDADKFWIDSGTGVLTFLSAPDYESPTDLGANNVYNLTVVVSDGLLTAQKDIVVTVTNVSDSPADYKTDWLTANGLSASSDWNSDPNNVGYSLATAYAFGLSPSVNSGAPVAVASSPAGSVKIVYLQRDISGGVTYTVKSGSDLAAGLNGTVTPSPSTVQPSPGKAGYTQYEATYTPSAPATKGFLKVQAVVP
jgi:autotransporter-associated beta strand protein